VPHFVDETDAAGVQSRFDGEWSTRSAAVSRRSIATAAACPSLFIAGGANRSRFYRNRSARGGALKFVQERAGLELTSTLGAYPIDLDGDGALEAAISQAAHQDCFADPQDHEVERAVAIEINRIGAERAGEFKAGALLHELERPAAGAAVAVKPGAIGAAGDEQGGQAAAVAIERRDTAADRVLPFAVEAALHTGRVGFVDDEMRHRWCCRSSDLCRGRGRLLRSQVGRCDQPRQSDRQQPDRSPTPADAASSPSPWCALQVQSLASTFAAAVRLSHAASAFAGVFPG